MLHIKLLVHLPNKKERYITDMANEFPIKSLMWEIHLP